MKRYLSILFLLPAVLSCSVAQEAVQRRYADLITEQTSKEHLSILAGPEMEGRGTGQKGGQKAAEYIAEAFKNYGLHTPVDGSYFQPVALTRTLLSVEKFSIAGIDYTNGKDFYVQTDDKIKAFTSDEIVFLGYGIQHEKYNDLSGIDIKDKVVFLINQGEPQDVQGNSLITGTKQESDWSRSRAKRLQEIIKLAPKLIIATSSQVDNMISRSRNRLTSGRISLKKTEETPQNHSNFPPVINATTQFANAILASASTSLDQAKQKISESKQPNSFVIPIDFNARLGVNTEDLSDPNVIGLLEGTDLKNEIVVIGGHYDHDGILPDGTYFPGADDNGTGTVAVLELAKAFTAAKKEGKGPRRSILFIAFSAEEKGLLGSNFYVENPIFPLEHTVACLNIDMIGRIDDKHLDGNHNYVHVIGTNKLSSDLNPIVENANNKFTQMELDSTYNDPNDPQRLYYRSDHYNFAKKGIPSLFFFSGLHPHYHTVEDTVDKIDFPMMVKREKLIFHVAWDLAHRDNRPVVDIPEPQ